MLKSEEMQMPKYQLFLSYDGRKYVVFRGSAPEYMPGEILCELERSMENLDWVIECFRECDNYSETTNAHNLSNALSVIDGIIDTKYGVASGAVIMSELSSRLRGMVDCPEISDGPVFPNDHINDEDGELVKNVLNRGGFNRIGMDTVGQALVSSLALSSIMVDKFLRLTSGVMKTLTLTAEKRDCSIIKKVIFESAPLIRAQQIEYRIMNIEDKLSNVYGIHDIMSALTFELANCLNNDVVMKTCGNCGKHFPLYGRSDTIYCPFPAPNCIGKTCKDVGAQVTRAKKEKNDGVTSEYRKMYLRLKMQARRHPDDQNIQNNLIRFVDEGKKHRALLEEGLISKEEYLEWLVGYSGKKRGG